MLSLAAEAGSPAKMTFFEAARGGGRALSLPRLIGHCTLGGRPGVEEDERTIDASMGALGSQPWISGKAGVEPDTETPESRICSRGSPTASVGRTTPCTQWRKMTLV